MAPRKRRQKEAEFDGRLSVRFDTETLIWLGKMAAAWDRDSSYVIRAAVKHARSTWPAESSRKESGA